MVNVFKTVYSFTTDDFHIGSNNHRSNSYLLKWVKNSDAQIPIFLPFFAQMSLHGQGVVEVGFPADYTFINTSGYHSRSASSTFLHFNLLLEKRLTYHCLH
jgi:hypothetical protein